MGRRIINPGSVRPRAGMPGGPRLTCSFRWTQDEFGEAIDFLVPAAPSFWQAPRSGELVVQRKIERMDTRDLVTIDVETGDVVRFAPSGEGLVDLALRRHRDGLVLPLGRVSLDDENVDPGIPDDPTDDLSAICPECEMEFASALDLVKPCPSCGWDPT